MKKFKIILLCVGLLPLLSPFQTMAKDKYRIEVKKIDGVVKYIPQAKINVGYYYFKTWVDIHNTPLNSKDDALDLIKIARYEETLSISNNKSTYIYIK